MSRQLSRTEEAAVQNVLDSLPLNVLRCRTCGTIMGYTRQRSADLTLWCSLGCKDIPISENNPRDELIVELQASGILVSQLARRFGITRQAVSQILDRRAGKVIRSFPASWKKPPQKPQPKPVAAKTVALPRRGRLK